METDERAEAALDAEWMAQQVHLAWPNWLVAELLKARAGASSQGTADRKRPEGGAKLPIDRPCAACSAGDYKMEHHLHYPPFREQGTAGALRPLWNALRKQYGIIAFPESGWETWEAIDKLIGEQGTAAPAPTTEINDKGGWDYTPDKTLAAIRGAALASQPEAPSQPESDDPPTCERCEEEYSLHDGMDPSRYCDSCAQERVSELEAEATWLREERDRLVTALSRMMQSYFPEDDPLCMECGDELGKTLNCDSCYLYETGLAALAPTKSQAPAWDSVCQKCGAINPTWFADNDVWNLVITEKSGVLCPSCFIAKADSVIANTGWKLVPETLAGEQKEKTQP